LVDTQGWGPCPRDGSPVPRPRRFFPPEYKAEVVELVRATGETVGQVARELDLTETAVRQWSAKLIWTQVAVAMASPPSSATSCAACAGRIGTCARSVRSSARPRFSSQGRPVAGELLPAGRRGEPHHEVSRLCRVLGVARAGYYAWTSRPPSERTMVDAYLTEQIRQIHARSRATYGAPRVHAELRLGLDIQVSRKRVARLMRDHGLQGVHRRRRYGSTRRDPTAAHPRRHRAPGPFSGRRGGAATQDGAPPWARPGLLPGSLSRAEEPIVPSTTGRSPLPARILTVRS
jgi:transposase-like protein